jgi:hypothetical protein
MKMALLRQAKVGVQVAVAAVGALGLCTSATHAGDATNTEQGSVTISWNQVQGVSKTTPTMQAVVQPPYRPTSTLHKPIYAAIRSLHANDMRLVPWMAQPRLAVAELSSPTKQDTSWSFKEIDPEVIPFLNATEGHNPIIDFSVIPRWMFKTSVNVPMPADPDTLVWNYSNISGTPFNSPGKVELADPTGKQIGDYYGRLVSWYTRGGFTDEDGAYHRSGYHYKFPWWEVLSELDNGEDIRVYNRLYDSMVTGIRKVSPSTKFIGFAPDCYPGSIECSPEYFEYFLDRNNHLPGIPIDMLSLHAYATPTPRESADQWQYTFFDQADSFLQLVQYVNAIRARLRPSAGIDVDELGCILPADVVNVVRGMLSLPPVKVSSNIPKIYWNACGAFFAYTYMGLVREDVDIVTASQLFGYPGQFPSVSLLYPNTGTPNARFHVLQLIVDNFHPGDKSVHTEVDFGTLSDVSAQAFVTPSGKRLLLVNKRNRTIDLSIKSAPQVSEADVVDSHSAGQEPRVERVQDSRVTLEPFAVAVLKFE